jgi:hypothetical protein
VGKKPSSKAAAKAAEAAVWAKAQQERHTAHQEAEDAAGYCK